MFSIIKISQEENFVQFLLGQKSMLYKNEQTLIRFQKFVDTLRMCSE